MRRIAFLDRDGTVVRAFSEDGTTRGPRNVSEVEVLPDALAAIELLRQNGYLPVSVTNQPDVARGRMSKLEAEHLDCHIGNMTGIEQRVMCCHDAIEWCSCRKPRPGMLYAAAVALDGVLEDSIIFGDRWTDIEAGKVAGLSGQYKIETNGSLLEAVKCALEIGI